MKTSLLFASATIGLALSLNAADSPPTTGPKDDILAAAKKLAATDNYSWKTTITVPEDAPFHPGPQDGKTEKEGVTFLSMSFGDNTTQAVLKGDKGAATSPDGGWQSLKELEEGEGPGQFLAMMLRNYKAPAAQATQLAGFAKELKKDGDVYSSDLTEAGAKTLLTFRPRNGDGPTVTDPKGSVKFWIRDGTITKYEFKVKGTVNFNGQDFPNDRTHLVEIKDVGTTKITVPEDAKKKLS
jgi:hypothetical protein